MTSKCLPRSADDVVVISTLCANIAMDSPMGNGVKSDDVTLGLLPPILSFLQ